MKKFSKRSPMQMRIKINMKLIDAIIEKAKKSEKG